mmetsp:Transcript_76702/g.165999  ORF Transcript_76702/g.165999 Transcript_76702/m.165999 type:complete len:215 (-) Transcript_76702:642-1286(-)
MSQLVFYVLGEVAIHHFADFLEIRLLLSVLVYVTVILLQVLLLVTLYPLNIKSTSALLFICKQFVQIRSFFLFLFLFLVLFLVLFFFVLIVTIHKLFLIEFDFVDAIVCFLPDAAGVAALAFPDEEAVATVADADECVMDELEFADGPRMANLLLLHGDCLKLLRCMDVQNAPVEYAYFAVVASTVEVVPVRVEVDLGDATRAEQRLHYQRHLP